MKTMQAVAAVVLIGITQLMVAQVMQAEETAAVTLTHQVLLIMGQLTPVVVAEAV